MAVQKIKVSREKLIQRVKDVEALEVAAYEVALAQYPDQIKEYNKAIIGLVRDIADKVKTDVTYRDEVEYSGSYNSRVFLPFKGEFPKKPSDPVYPSKHATVIRQLELAADDTLSIEIHGSYRSYL